MDPSVLLVVIGLPASVAAFFTARAVLAVRRARAQRVKLDEEYGVARPDRRRAPMAGYSRGGSERR